MENRSGLVVGAAVSYANGFAELASALWLLDCVPAGHAKTVDADKGYDTRGFVDDCRPRECGVRSRSPRSGHSRFRAVDPNRAERMPDSSTSCARVPNRFRPFSTLVTSLVEHRNGLGRQLHMCGCHQVVQFIERGGAGT